MVNREKIQKAAEAVRDQARAARAESEKERSNKTDVTNEKGVR